MASLLGDSLTTPPTPSKRTGWKIAGCLGCGCLLPILIIIIGLKLFSSWAYRTYTSPSPLVWQEKKNEANTSNLDYQEVLQKLTTLPEEPPQESSHSIVLTRDELNCLLQSYIENAPKNFTLYARIEQITDQHIVIVFTLQNAALQKAQRYVNGRIKIQPQLEKGDILFIRSNIELNDQELPKSLLGQIGTMQLSLRHVLHQSISDEKELKQIEKLLTRCKKIDLRPDQIILMLE